MFEKDEEEKAHEQDEHSNKQRPYGYFLQNNVARSFHYFSLGSGTIRYRC